jgi:uncharacterized protein (DUF1501 family)
MSNCCGTHGSYTRRHFLFGTAGAVSAGLLGTPCDAATASANVKPRGTAKACILINLSGAPSHIDTFDPKDGPWNPRDIDLQQYGNIILSRRLFPKLSDLTSDLCILRSVTSWEAAHSRGQFYLQTAHTFNPAFAPALPHIGAVASFELGGKGPLPPFLSMNTGGDEQRQGFLPGITAPFVVAPWRTGLFNLRHDFYGSQSQSFFNNSYDLLRELDAPWRDQPLNDAMAAYAAMQGQARGLVYNDAVGKVFQFSQEDEGRFGNNNLGRALIVARNAVQSRLGTVFVNVTYGGWDQHARQFDAGNGLNLYRLANDLDQALANLIADLRISGDLDSTLIVALGEFGRTPGPLNVRDGRDHYRAVMSALMVGGGVRGGQAIGVTDETGADIVDPGWSGQRPIYTEDIVSTIYSALGIDWTKAIENTPMGRRYVYVFGTEDGSYGPVEEVFR